MAFDFGKLTPFLQDKHVTDIDSNGTTVYIKHDLKGKYKVLELEKGELKGLLDRISNYVEINQEFNYHKPIIDGTMDGYRIHAEHESNVAGYWLSIRRNPIELVTKREDYPKLFELLDIGNALGWSYCIGGERGSGKTQLQRAIIANLLSDKSVKVIAENDEMHMKELLPDRLISQFIVNEIADYKEATKSALRDDSDYIAYQEIRDCAMNDAMYALSASSRVMFTTHLKSGMLMPERIIQLLSAQGDIKYLVSTIHDFIQMCIVPKTVYIDGKAKRFIKEIVLFWTENGEPMKQLVYTNNGNDEKIIPLPKYYTDIFKEIGVDFKW